MNHREEPGTLNVDQIIDPKFLLRFVKEDSIEFLELMDSIEKTGIWQPICVREAGDRAPGKYEVIDGFHRLTCCRKLRRETVPVLIRFGLTDDEVLAAQIRAQAVCKQTTPSEFAMHLRRIQKLRPGITMVELSVLVNKEKKWIGQQLGLLNLDSKVLKLVDRGEIPMQSAYMLAKVPRSLQVGLIEGACAMPVEPFRALAASVIKGFMEQVRQGKLDNHFNDLPFTPQPYLRGLKHVIAEAKNRVVGPTAVVVAGAKTAVEGFYLALDWVMNLDTETVEKQRKSATGKQREDLLKLYEEREVDYPHLEDPFESDLD